jgi:protocatechuate 4,5-dioxygenase alpha subunit
MRTRLYSLDELNDIPGTTVFNAQRSRQAVSPAQVLHVADAGRTTATPFRADERAYLDRFRMSDEQKQAVLERDFTRLIDLGGNIYFLVKLSNTDGWTTQKAVSSMTSMTPDEYAAMMRAGGRSPEGPALDPGQEVMARITAGIATSHVPAIGAAFDQGRDQDEYWKPVFDAYEWVKDFSDARTPTSSSCATTTTPVR